MEFLRKIPGFRSGTKWKQVVAVCGYGLLVLIIIGALSGPPDEGGSAPVASETTAPAQEEPAASTEEPTAETTSPAPQPSPAPAPEPEPEPEPGFGDGTHIVGEDIKPGTYRSTASGGLCYWARLSGFSGELDDILANGSQSPEIVTISDSDTGFQTQGCGQWVPIEEIEASTVSEFNDGTYLVGEQIEPGTYRAEGEGGICYWARLSNFDQDLDGILANGTNAGVVEISSSDAGFKTFGCGTWSKT